VTIRNGLAVMTTLVVVIKWTALFFLMMLYSLKSFRKSSFVSIEGVKKKKAVKTFFSHSGLNFSSVSFLITYSI